MPQKKNPDAAELLRAKAPRVAAHLNALLGVMHALPLAYNKDMQEDKEHLFDTVDTLNLCLDAATGMLRTAEFDRERLAGAAADEFLAATDIADLLVRRGVPFRESHAIVGGLVRHALEQDKQLSELTREELAGFSEQPRRRVLRGAVERLVAGVEGVGGRHGLGQGRGAARPRPRNLGGSHCRSDAEARSTHGVARLRQVREGGPRSTRWCRSRPRTGETAAAPTCTSRARPADRRVALGTRDPRRRRGGADRGGGDPTAAPARGLEGAGEPVLREEGAAKLLDATRWAAQC